MNVTQNDRHQRNGNNIYDDNDRSQQLMDLHAPMAKGCSVWFAQPDALKGSLVKTLREVRPTIFVGVPRVRSDRGAIVGLYKQARSPPPMTCVRTFRRVFCTAVMKRCPG